MMDHLKEILGKKNVSDAPEKLEKYSVAGKIPALLLFPTSSDQIAEIMKLAKRDGKKVLVAGNSSQRHFGSAIEAFDWCISLNRMNNIIEHEAADLTVTVESGVTLPRLQKFLNQQRQFLPLDPFGADIRTLGGIVATNSSGAFRLLYGTCRDLVLGMKVVLPDGTIIRAGGKTVKNVAGYDLSKLFIGSMGTLGIIVEITFKLFPLPVQSQTLCAEFEKFDGIPKLIQSIGSSNLVISRCEYFNAAFIEKYLAKEFRSKAPHCLLFNVQGQAEMVNATIEKLQQMLTARGGKNIQNFFQKDDTNLWNKISSLSSTEHKFQPGLHGQVSIPKAFFEQVINAIHKYSIENGFSIAIQAHAGNGIINILGGELIAERGEPDRYRRQIETLRQIAQSYQGNLVVQYMTVTSEVTVMSAPELIWGKPGGDFPLMKTIKAKYDSHSVLAAGRFIGGL